MSGQLHTKLAAVMEAVSYIPKTGRNVAQGYAYAEASAVADKVRDELAKRGVSFVPQRIELIESGETFGDKKQLRLTLRYTWLITDAESGETTTVQSIGSGTDPLDKAPYKAATGALKYALITTFLIPTGDDPEADGAPARRTANRPVARAVLSPEAEPIQRHPYTCGTCAWGRDGNYHDEAEYRRHMETGHVELPPPEFVFSAPPDPPPMNLRVLPRAESIEPQEEPPPPVAEFGTPPPPPAVIGAMCPKHPGERWKGKPGDLYHAKAEGGYCRPAGQPRKGAQK